MQTQGNSSDTDRDRDRDRDASACGIVCLEGVCVQGMCLCHCVLSRAHVRERERAQIDA